jgi:hypothetical protein
MFGAVAVTTYHVCMYIPKVWDVLVHVVLRVTTGESLAMTCIFSMFVGSDNAFYLVGPQYIHGLLNLGS